MLGYPGADAIIASLLFEELSYGLSMFFAHAKGMSLLRGSGTLYDL